MIKLELTLVRIRRLKTVAKSKATYRITYNNFYIRETVKKKK